MLIGHHFTKPKVNSSARVPILSLLYIKPIVANSAQNFTFFKLSDNLQEVMLNKMEARWLTCSLVIYSQYFPENKQTLPCISLFWPFSPYQISVNISSRCQNN